MAFVIEMTGFDPVLETDRVFRFAYGAGVALDDGYAEPGLATWASPTQRITIGSSGRVEIGADVGEMIISNTPPTADDPGPWDALLDMVWHNRIARLYSVGSVWADRVLVAWGALETPFGNLVSDNTSVASIRFPLRDPRAALEAPLQPSKFKGDNVGPVGVEGGADMKGRPKPILYGAASNLPIPRVNESLLIYQVADRAVSVLCARDGGVALGGGVQRGTLASLVANNAGPGKFDIYAGAEGTFIRLGSSPVYNITVDAMEGANAADRSHAKIWARMRAQRCMPPYTFPNAKVGSTTAAAAAAPGEAGFWWASEIDQKAALDQVLSGMSGFEVLDQNEVWQIRQVAIPSGATVIDLERLTTGARLSTKSRRMTSLQRVRSSYAPNGVPPYRITIKWGRNHVVMNEADFAGGAIQRLRDKFAEEWRLETVTRPEIWNPDDNTGLFPNAPELTVETGYTPGPDGLTCPAAQTEAARLAALLCVQRGQYQVSFVPEISDHLLPGDVVSARHATSGLSAGPLFRVLQSSKLLGSKGLEMDLIVGLQA